MIGWQVNYKLNSEKKKPNRQQCIAGHGQQELATSAMRAVRRNPAGA